MRPRPASAPVYPAGSAKLSATEARRWGLDDVLDALFFAAAALAALWLAWLLLGSGWHLEPWAALNVVLFWVVLAYLALPRLHQVLTWLYVPEYFIGRTRTADGLLGDPVNLAVQGHEEDIHEAMTTAGWVRADPISLRTSWNIVVSSLLRRSYPAAPVSDLLLFGRKQDFAYQKEVEGNPAQRHHIRFWHAPSGWVMPGGRRVEWLAAATYDRSVGLSTLTLQVTHKIDANIDVERNYVVDDVLWANQAAELSVWPDFFTAYHDKNGGGDRVVTDGDLYVLDLNEVVPGLRGSSELAEARQAEAQVRRRRPPELVVAVVLLVLVTVVNVLRLVTSGVVGTLADGLEGAGVADERGAVLTVAVTVTVILMAAIAGLGVAAWFGHPRGRIALMVFLTLHIINTMTQVSAVGERQAGWGVVVSASLSVLALLAMSARPCHEWERARKTERLRVREGEPVREGR
ncbi:MULTISPECIES: LssY C-terminal domain-containing protein [Actinomyces]|uniref:LssY C-terminal domain-containing protein n=1 Tax=Actinomyces TaxID=1654 RepID=UPI001FA969C6|nr:MULTISPECIES: LssY C-terminal domain-containing protein [Actinomyces]